MTRTALHEWREAGFATDSPEDSVLALVDCLPASDPFLRDRIGYDGMSTLLRTADIGVETRRELLRRLTLMIAAPDSAGFASPFAALALSEVARTDRIDPFLSSSERSALVTTAVSYLRDVDDYRGFVDGDGWRHAVAHGADLALQLVLNSQVSDVQVLSLADAAAFQVNPSVTHSYVFGEPSRLARPILYGALRESLDAAVWKALFAKVADPAPLASWNDAFESEAGLAKLHNTRAFAQAVYVAGTLSGSDQLEELTAQARQLLELLP